MQRIGNATRGSGYGITQSNMRYSNTNTTSYDGNRNQTTSSNYTRTGGVQKITTTTTTTTTTTNSRYGQNNASDAYRGSQRNQSYVNNRNQSGKSGINISAKARSPEPGSFKKKTINRGKPVENIQITHIIFSSRPADFHIKEKLDLENLNTNPIQISKADRMKLQKSGKVTSTCSCDGVDTRPKKINLKGETKIYQHARGIGMTNDRKENINPMFYSSEIKKLDPIYKKKDQEKLENIETFRSNGKVYNNSTYQKTSNKTPTYNRGGMNNSSSQKRTYNSGYSNNNYNRGGMVSSTKTTTTTRVYNGGNYEGGDGEIIKETNTKVQMGSRSQYNQSKPVVYNTSERKVYNQKNFFNK
jgi:hypothetical protein